MHWKPEGVRGWVIVYLVAGGLYWTGKDSDDDRYVRRMYMQTGQLIIPHLLALIGCWSIIKKLLLGRPCPNGDNLDLVVVIQIGDGDPPAATWDCLLGSRWRLVARTPGGFDRQARQVSGQVRPGHVT